MGRRKYVKIIIICTKCGKKYTGFNQNKLSTCEDCKKKRQKEYYKKHK